MRSVRQVNQKQPNRSFLRTNLGGRIAMAAPPSHADQQAAHTDMAVYRIGNPGRQNFAVISKLVL
jgi:hypothetical protein